MIEISKDGTININGWQEGIGNSNLDNFSDMLGVNIVDNPGCVSENFKFQPVIETYASRTIIFSGSDYVNISAGGSTYRGTYIGRAIKFSSTGTLPSGINSNTVYYIGSNGVVNENTFRISSSLSQAITGTGYVSIGTGGSGVYTINFVTPTLITGYTKNSQGKIFAIDDSQRVWFAGLDGVNDPWYLISGNTNQGGGDGNGIIYYKGYLLVWSTSSVDALLDIQSPSDVANWTLNFDGAVTISNSMSNGGKGAVPFLSVNDDAIYFSNGVVGNTFRVGLLEENAGTTFNPSSSSTFSFVPDVVTLPFENSKGFATSIKEINAFIVIGTYSDKIFFWDKKSPSFTSFIQIPESGISNMESIGGLIYALIGDSGSIYICNTVSFSNPIKFPEQLSDQYYLFNYGLNSFQVNSTSIYKRELLFSISILGISDVKNYLMSYNIDTKKITKKNISYYGETTDKSGASFGKIGSIIPFGKNIFISSSKYNTSSDITNYEIESLLYVASTESGNPGYFVYDNYEPNIITGLFAYGDTYSKRTTKELSVSFLRPLVTGQGFRISYRYDDNSAWSTPKEISYTNSGAVKQIKLPYLITDIIDLQIKIELKGINQSSPRLKIIRLIP